MLVGDDHGVQILRHPPDRLEPGADLAQAESGINENACAVCFQIGAISGGAAAEDGQVNWHTPAYFRAVEAINAFSACDFPEGRVAGGIIRDSSGAIL
jgi:hypothetical protein